MLYVTGYSGTVSAVKKCVTLFTRKSLFVSPCTALPPRDPHSYGKLHRSLLRNRFRIPTLHPVSNKHFHKHSTKNNENKFKNREFFCSNPANNISTQALQALEKKLMWRKSKNAISFIISVNYWKKWQPLIAQECEKWYKFAGLFQTWSCVFSW